MTQYKNPCSAGTLRIEQDFSSIHITLTVNLKALHQLEKQEEGLGWRTLEDSFFEKIRSSIAKELVSWTAQRGKEVKA